MDGVVATSGTEGSTTADDVTRCTDISVEVTEAGEKQDEDEDREDDDGEDVAKVRL